MIYNYRSKKIGESKTIFIGGLYNYRGKLFETKMRKSKMRKAR